MKVAVLLLSLLVVAFADGAPGLIPLGGKQTTPHGKMSTTPAGGDKTTKERVPLNLGGPLNLGVVRDLLGGGDSKKAGDLAAVDKSDVPALPALLEGLPILGDLNVGRAVGVGENLPVGKENTTPADDGDEGEEDDGDEEEEGGLADVDLDVGKAVDVVGDVLEGGLVNLGGGKVGELVDADVKVGGKGSPKEGNENSESSKETEETTPTTSEETSSTTQTPEPTTAPTPEPTTAPTPEPTTAPTTKHRRTRAPKPTAAPTTSEPTTAPTTEGPTTPPSTPPTTGVMSTSPKGDHCNDKIKWKDGKQTCTPSEPRPPGSECCGRDDNGETCRCTLELTALKICIVVNGNAEN